MELKGKGRVRSSSTSRRFPNGLKAKALRLKSTICMAPLNARREYADKGEDGVDFPLYVYIAAPKQLCEDIVWIFF
jgi:hypothetical protein